MKLLLVHLRLAKTRQSNTKLHKMKIVEIELPENTDLTPFDVRMSLASKLYEQGKLSGGQAAELVGISKRTFIELLGKYDVSVFGYDSTELLEDLKNAE